ncbi:MAG TPA: polymer-forming cytoskeletal protein [Thermodesulfobacteriota bacterium]
MIGTRKGQRDGDAMAAAGDLTAFLDKGSRFEGKLAFDGHVRLNGEFKGEIRAEGTLIVGEGARIEAQIAVDTLVVSGTIVGDIVARSRIEMHAPARVTGNITTPVLVVDEGSVFDGQCHMERVREADASRGAPRPVDALPAAEDAPSRVDA